MGASPTTYHQQFIHGTQYIDEVVMVRAIDKGDLYIHQDANWNVIGTTDLAASIVERNVYTPYGQLTVNQETSFGDRDGDGDVDATDKGTPGTTCTGTVTGACRILDLDFDGDYDAADATKFDALTQGIARHQGRTATATNQPFGHQSLLFEPEIGSYQNRARQYDPSRRQFVQTDSLAMKPLRRDFVWVDDGRSSYQAVKSSPTMLQDPSGRAVCTGLFNPGTGACSAALACTGCNGNGGVVVCMNTIEWPGSDTGGCNPVSNIIIKRCVCQHEKVHVSDYTIGHIGCSRKLDQSPICTGIIDDGNPATFGFPPTCNSCCLPRTEINGYTKEKSCLNSTNPAVNSAEWQRLQFVTGELARQKTELQQCEATAGGCSCD